MTFRNLKSNQTEPIWMETEPNRFGCSGWTKNWTALPATLCLFSQMEVRFLLEQESLNEPSSKERKFCRTTDPTSISINCIRIHKSDKILSWVLERIQENLIKSNKIDRIQLSTTRIQWNSVGFSSDKESLATITNIWWSLLFWLFEYWWHPWGKGASQQNHLLWAQLSIGNQHR